MVRSDFLHNVKGKSLILLAVLCCMPMTADAANGIGDPKVQRTAMFGFATSFKDSVVCLTEIQTLDSAWIEPSHKFLMDRSLYSLQLQMYLESKGYKNAICTVFFDKDQRKLARTWRKMRRRYHKGFREFRYKLISAGEFSFHAEEYRPVIIE